ncbi:UNVERIFIED_CONTAM: hypothetical protein NCL1_43416 [Trichonephila clavipes]
MATNTLPRNSHQLFIHDRSSNVKFLIDIGSDISIIPATKSPRQNYSQMNLSAINTSPTHVFTAQTLSLDFGLRRIFECTFLVNIISTPITGADYFYITSVKLLLLMLSDRQRPDQGPQNSLWRRAK